MKEHEIFEQLCCHISVLTESSPMDNSFFKHCYGICMKNKDNITKDSIWEIVNKEAELFQRRDQEFKRIIDRLYIYI